MKKHGDLSSEDPEQICKSILEDVINDIHNKDETSMYRKKPKINDLHSDEMDESALSTDEIDDEELDKMIVNDNTPTGASTNPKNFDLNKNLNLTLI